MCKNNREYVFLNIKQNIQIISSGFNIVPYAIISFL